ncbi:glycosyltransferase [Peribacillus sp. NPDC006672]|uniref:glycosyltransferase n=1 Tax=Peribacillus sp. NPDC006672 TaxID=3390606 RepID=UPI003CFFAC8A
MKNITPIITIVVPVYKVEKYLEKCVNSLIHQTLKDIEIILVDDGSPDSCPKICDEYAKADLRIKVIHKENGGLSDARNVGVREATGEYILFVDSDDFIELDTCERFIENIGNHRPDLVVGNARKINNGEIMNMQHQFNTNGQMITGKEYLKKELNSGTMHMAVWLNLYSRNFLVNNKLEFKVGLLHEDEQYTPRIFLKSKTVIGTDIIFYNYLIRDGSITTAQNKTKNAEHIMQTCRELEEIYNGIDDVELRRLLNDNLVNKLLYIYQVAGLHKKENSYLIDKKFLKGKAYTRRNKLRVFIFQLNSMLYYNLNIGYKRFKEKFTF